MKFIEKIVSFFKNKFLKEGPQMISEPQTLKQKEKTKEFANSLKVEKVSKEKKGEIETLTCVGDGLGMKRKISY